MRLLKVGNTFLKYIFVRFYQLTSWIDIFPIAKFSSGRRDVVSYRLLKKTTRNATPENRQHFFKTNMLTVWQADIFPVIIHFSLEEGRCFSIDDNETPECRQYFLKQIFRRYDQLNRRRDIFYISPLCRVVVFYSFLKTELRILKVGNTFLKHMIGQFDQLKSWRISPGRMDVVFY